MNSFLLPCRKHMCSAAVGLILLADLSSNVMGQDRGFGKETGNTRSGWDLLRGRCSHLLSAHKPTSSFSNLHLWWVSLSSQPPLANYSSGSTSPFLPKLIHSTCCFSGVKVVLSSPGSFSLLCIPLTYMVTEQHSLCLSLSAITADPSVTCLCCPVPEFLLSTGSHTR